MLRLFSPYLVRSIPLLQAIIQHCLASCEDMKKAELVFIPAPGLGHLVSTVEAAKLLIHHDGRLSITVLIMKLSQESKIDNYIHKVSSNPNTQLQLRFIRLPSQDETPQASPSVFQYIDSLMNPIREIISNLINHPSESESESSSFRLVGLVLDMFSTKFMDIANEFNLPSYVFYTSGAYALGMMNYLVRLKYDEKEELSKYRNSDVELHVPCFSNPVPAKVLPAVVVQEGPISAMFMSYFKRIRDSKGILVNTFYELESYAIQSMLDDDKFPKVYPVGPILNLPSSSSDVMIDELKKWLDDQPEKSVVFLCFGSMGSFEQPQVKEIAEALEKSGTHFLWSLRKPGVRKEGMMAIPTEYEDFEQVLPEGFSDRTKGFGKVIGWAPQTAVLEHPAIGGFVSHCGWNSILESVWFGVPVATFPLSAEQQANAFELVRELEMAVPIRIDYTRDYKGGGEEIVGAEEIEAAIRRLMAEGDGNGVRQKVKEMQKKSRSALMEGGSSDKAQTIFIQDVLRSI